MTTKLGERYSPSFPIFQTNSRRFIFLPPQPFACPSSRSCFSKAHASGSVASAAALQSTLPLLKTRSRTMRQTSSRQRMSAPGSGEGAAVLAQALVAYGCRHVFGVVSSSRVTAPCSLPSRPADKHLAGRRSHHGVWNGVPNRRSQLHWHAKRAGSQLRRSSSRIPRRHARRLPRRQRSRGRARACWACQCQGELLANDPHRRRIRHEPELDHGVPGVQPGKHEHARHVAAKTRHVAAKSLPRLNSSALTSSSRACSTTSTASPSSCTAPCGTRSPVVLGPCTRRSSPTALL